jgi:hypothetical protein
MSSSDANKVDASVILDTFGDIDIAYDVDHYIGSGDDDIFFGSSEGDTFDAAIGTGNFMSGGAGDDKLIVKDYGDGDSENLDLSTMEVSRSYSFKNHNDVNTDNGKFVNDSDNDHSDGSFYRIDTADLSNLSSFFEGHVSTDVSSKY